MIAACCQKNGTVAESLNHLKTEYARIKLQRTVEVRNLQVHVADARSDIDCVGWFCALARVRRRHRLDAVIFN
jgi:hypothetical protein